MRTQVPYASGQRPVTVNSAQISPRILFPEDAFPVIRGLDSESIDPIATDRTVDKGERTRGNQIRLGFNAGYKDVWRHLGALADAERHEKEERESTRGDNDRRPQ